MFSFGAVVRAARSALVVEAEEGGEVRLGVDHRLVTSEVDLVVFDRPPESFDEDVVEAPALAVHRELHAAGEERLGKFFGGELTALIGVENFRSAVLRERALHGPDTEAGIIRRASCPSKRRSGDRIGSGAWR